MWLFACEGRSSEPAYIQALSKLYSDFVSIKIVPDRGGDSHPTQVLQRLTARRKELESDSEDQDRYWCVIDVDPHAEPSRGHRITELLERAGRENVGVVLSNPCFEHWLRQHISQYDGGFGTASEAVSDLQTAWEADAGLPGRYDKANARNARFDKLVTLDRVRQAAEHARKLHRQKGNAMTPDLCSPCATDFYRIIEELEHLREAANT
ncbi:hypothetical protein AY599_15630 [Leptolyngbya valderiana BDU 20041]|nr:hypothetical protein AY599_15630 [Leptolyngbya valderiana BDU 20041]